LVTVNAGQRSDSGRQCATRPVRVICAPDVLYGLSAELRIVTQAEDYGYRVSVTHQEARSAIGDDVVNRAPYVPILFHAHGPRVLDHGDPPPFIDSRQIAQSGSVRPLIGISIVLLAVKNSRRFYHRADRRFF
jgi:hypothetical protein